MKLVKKLFSILISVLLLVGISFAGFWFSRPADISFEEHKTEIPHSAYSKFAEINGVKLHYQEKGEGTPLVLIHGYTSLTYTWKDVFEPLSKDFRVIAIDLKGFGFSEKPAGDYSRQEQAVLVKGLLDHLKIESAWLAGSSMGGEVSINIALQNRDRVKGLILIDSSGVSYDAKSTSSSETFKIPYIGRAFAAVALTSDRYVRSGLERSYYDDSQISDQDVKIYHLPLSVDYGQRAAALAAQQWDLHSVENDLPKLKIPSLLIWGEEDIVVPLGAGKKMHSLIKGSKFVAYKKVGHLPQEEAPKKLIKDISDFINTLEMTEEEVPASKNE